MAYLLVGWTLILVNFILDAADATHCNSTAAIISYHAQPSSFRGELTLNEHPLRDTRCFVAASGQLLCGPEVILGDGDTDMEPAQPNLDDANNRLYEIKDFLIWIRSSLHPYVSIQYSVGSFITAIKLNFLNYPAENVSLPNIQLQSINNFDDTTGVNVHFVLLGNEELSQDDYKRTSVTLLLSTPLVSNLVLLRWSFDGVYNLDWFFLSEVTFCTDPQQSYSPSTIRFLSPEMNETIQPSGEDLASGTLVLTCSVSNQGSFSWKWRQNDTVMKSNNKFQTFTADGTRTSKLNISQLNFMDEATYTCEASHQSSHSTQNLKEYQVAFPVFVETQQQVTGYLGEKSVILTCEVYGYLREPPFLSWYPNSGQELVNNNKYSIESSPGSEQVWFEDGTIGISTLFSLTIQQLNETDEGNYSCKGVGRKNITVLVVVEGTAPPSMQALDFSCTIIAVVSSVASFIITALLSVIITVSLHCYKKKHTNCHDHQESEEEDAVYDVAQEKSMTLQINTNTAYVKTQAS